MPIGTHGRERVKSCYCVIMIICFVFVVFLESIFGELMIQLLNLFFVILNFFAHRSFLGSADGYDVNYDDDLDSNKRES